MTKTFHLVDEDDAQRRSIPVGRPMPGVRLALLNETLKPVADGVVGEIVIRTPFMTLGYFNNPEETRKRFIPNPLSDNPDDFVYRTGDYGRIDPNGELEFLGRRDRQVKSAGIRIELEEVETAVLSVPGVQQAAVKQVVPDEGDPYICAYVVATETIDVASARILLGDWLPPTALPALFISMGELPRTISGKVDHGALPEPVLIVDGECVEPRNSTEELVLDLWSQLLPATSNLGVTHNFFAVGGHSLLVMRLIALVEDELGVSLNLRDLLEQPTVERMASLIEEAFVADLSSDEALLRELLEVGDEVQQAGG